ncbi:hypothetical protein [Kineococcus terrestris]|uniref:hypothetical protein n=1 Tax=Kineococcus terrestris TaxID=2044856 RepID=UPI0034DB5A48
MTSPWQSPPAHRPAAPGLRTRSWRSAIATAASLGLGTGAWYALFGWALDAPTGTSASPAGAGHYLLAGLLLVAAQLVTDLLVRQWTGIVLPSAAVAAGMIALGVLDPDPFAGVAVVVVGVLAAAALTPTSAVTALVRRLVRARRSTRLRQHPASGR